ncbi:hypothetical protein CCMA1212_005374 [Trichoderma ghanense]|uniref:Uncharacterized protein n=1 Tax=Trichoderma ghanense TaxID=65468 RepID=A0ABY2H7K9_9HYPO
MRAWHDKGSASASLIHEPLASDCRGTAEQSRPTGTVAAAVSGLSLSLGLSAPWDVDKGFNLSPRKSGCSTPSRLHPTPSYEYTPSARISHAPPRHGREPGGHLQDPQTPKAGSKDKKSASSLGFQSFPPHFLVHPSP